MWLYINMACIG
ncbi:hypothetical protein F383_30072 [Gossypium arboreum]|uniref:Uncharacterized protein n=1 Tax=Gossypium arboreum TaxID=29729 RepID=A0A0B0MX53_GOSAR|nr:hypothetical protein F383_30072 [Gossypium arboreum]